MIDCRFKLIWLCFAAVTTVAHSSGYAETTPDLREPRLTADDYGHWSFKPPQRPRVPVVKGISWPRNDIDRFILAKLESENLKPLPQAGKHTLIRRVTFDLTGLPPTPAEVDAFIKDESPQAYEKLVDRLLASPACGERWAQHWLDVARFAETDGFEHDKVRPQAWRFRDWVIAALNDDMPYDRFIRSQIAGDELPDGHDSVATGFLMAGPDFPDINLQEERLDTKLNEMTATVAQAVLGLTIGCAQCHNHKFDPISQADFYRLRAVFANALHPKKDQLFATVASEPGAKAPPSFMMLRGDFRKPGPAIEPGFPRVLNPKNETIAPPAADAKTSGRRAALAHWLTRPEHPLTARVAVNRFWLHHFGRGLVGTPGDFGYLGDTPTHAELLDWLAVEFVSSAKPQAAWSMKRLHRLIVTSAAYMQASRPHDAEWDEATRAVAVERWAANKAIDRENGNYWRMNRRRLEGEAVRDAMLAASGRLNDQRGGPGVLPPLPAEVAATLLKDQWKVSPDEADHRRRSIYLFARRNLRYPLFEVFDKPDTNASCPQRPRSTTATQSLMLLNSALSLDIARSMAGGALAAEKTSAAQVAHIYRQALGRSPSADESRLSEVFLQLQGALLRKENRQRDRLALPVVLSDDLDPFDSAAFVDFCLGIINSNEFIYVD